MMSKERFQAPIFILPLVLLLLIFILLPVLGTIWTSLWQDVSFIAHKFIWFDNYLRLLYDQHFWQSLIFTILFPIVSVSLEMCAGMACALVLHEKFPARGLVRGIALLPWAIPSVIGARTWQMIWRYDFGLANHLLNMLGFSSINWLGSNIGAFWALILTDVWRTTPFVTIILLAGLQTVPDELYEQAKIDGANMVQRFLHVTLPVTKPILIVALLFRTIDALRVFDIIYVITGGGPGGFTTSLSLYGYKFFLLGDFGYGSAASVILFVIALVLALFYLKLGRIKESLS